MKHVNKAIRGRRVNHEEMFEKAELIVEESISSSESEEPENKINSRKG